MRIDRIHLVADGEQRPDQQPPVGLDPDGNLGRVLGVGSHQDVHLPHPGQPIGDPPGR
jgi:hypothetical protein